MAHKARHANGKHFDIQLDGLEMLKLEKLMRILDQANGTTVFLGSEENAWLSGALMLFAPELPPGTYQL